jgi:hypothetical protein
MSARLLITLSIVAAGLLAPAADAVAATKPPTRYPTISKVEPLRVSIGDTLTITGKGFLKGAQKNTVVFRRDGKRSVFVKADGLSTTRLSLRLPTKLKDSLGTAGGKATSTRFRLRVLAKRFGKGYTPLKSSPIVLPLVAPTASTPAAELARLQAAAAAAAAAPVATQGAMLPAPPPPDCDADGQLDSADADDDNDLLVDTIETSVGTNRCMADTDGDGMTDGWEYKSAIDFNQPSCPDTEYPVPCAAARPFPKKMPYTNPLNKDADVDYDGDFLTAGNEFEAWRRKPGRNLTELWYSDGLQSSIDSDAGDGCRGMTIPAYLMGRPEYTLDRHNWRPGDLGCLSDDERDEDGDFLGNFEELNAELSNAGWWQKVYEEPPFRNELAGMDWLDKDTDGDGVLDGIDDVDQDGFWNVEELERGTPSSSEVDMGDGPDPDHASDGTAASGTGVRTGLWVNPFNPCLPAPTAEKCPRALLVDGAPWLPFFKDEPPKTRWPLYGFDSDAFLIEGELFGGIAKAQQTLPPTHPLLPRPS